LFVSYINDVATAISSDSDVNMFADDIALYRVIRTGVEGICRKMLILFPSALVKNFFTSTLTRNGTVLSRFSSYKHLGVTAANCFGVVCELKVVYLYSCKTAPRPSVLMDMATGAGLRKRLQSNKAPL